MADLIGDQVIISLYSLANYSTSGTSKILGDFFRKLDIDRKRHTVEVRDPIDLYTDIKKYLLGASVGARVVPGVTNIPIIGLVKMFSGNQGAEIGGCMVEDLSKNS